MQLCTMEQHSHWPLALASRSQVPQWLRLSTLLCSATSFSAWPRSRSHQRTCLVWPSPLVSQLVDMLLVLYPVDL